VREGEVVADKYRIGKQIGSGAMGTVFAAHHLLLDQKVAIKFLVPEALGHSDAVARFVREARAAVAIKSEHVVRVLDVALLEGGAPYIVMEYLEGCDLAAWLHVYGRMEVAVAVQFVLQACDAIADAHDLGIIHRDIKPANLFAVQRLGVVETIKVLDFGVSKAAGLFASATSATEGGPGGAVITQERVPIGSPCYMSPEQMESARDVDCRTDIWALGVTLCELVTGHLPFEGQSLVQVYSRIKSGARLRLRDGSPHMPRALEAVILKCLETDREDRYRNVGELAMALAAFGSNLGATYPERTGGLERGSETGLAEGQAKATPSPRVLSVHGTLVSQMPGVAQARRKMSATTVWAFACLALVAAAGGIRVVSRSLSHDSSAASMSPPVTVSSRGALQASPAEPGLGTANPGVEPRPSSNQGSVETVPTAAPRASSSGPGLTTVARGSIALTAPLAVAQRDAGSSPDRDPGGGEHPPASQGASAREAPLPSVRPTSAPSHEWSPPDFPK
jgi:serine/threonine-protein kinase